MPSAFDAFSTSSDPDELSTPIGPKLAATAVLIAAGLAAFGGAALTDRLQVALNSFVAQPAPAPVRIVDAAQRPGIPCAQQTWPYIDAQCLKPGSDKIAKADAPEYGPPVVEAPKAEPRPAPESTAQVARLDDAPQMRAAPVVGLTSEPDAAALANVPLPLPRPVAADDRMPRQIAADGEDELRPPMPVERRPVRARRTYGNPGERLVRQLNRVIPFGILRF